MGTTWGTPGVGQASAGSTGSVDEDESDGNEGDGDDAPSSETFGGDDDDDDGHDGTGDEGPDDGGDSGGPDDEPPPGDPDPGFPPVGSFDDPGPFSVTTRYNDGPAGAFALHYPSDVASSGFEHPILTWGNGTFAIPQYYSGLLEHLASHGFVVIASNSTQTGSGAAMVEGVDWLVAQNEVGGSEFFGALDVDAIGSLGHSQGGGGSINAGGDPRIATVVPIQPAPGSVSGLHGTMFVMSGGSDTIVSPGLVEALVYGPSTVPTFYGRLEGASHFEPVGDAGRYRGPITAWLRMELMGDVQAQVLFLGDACELCTDPSWVTERKNM